MKPPLALGTVFINKTREQEELIEQHITSAEAGVHFVVKVQHQKPKDEVEEKRQHPKVRAKKQTVGRNKKHGKNKHPR